MELEHKNGRRQRILPEDLHESTSMSFFRPNSVCVTMWGPDYPF